MSANKISAGLGLLCVCLIAGLIYRHIRAIKEEASSEQKIETIQTELQETSVHLTLTQQTNVVLKSDLERTSTELSEVRELQQSLSDDLSREKARAQAAILETQTALEEVAERDGQIKELTFERNELSQQAISLNQSLENLQTRIEDAEFKLATSEGDREFLLNELKRLQTEKADIEKKFNDIPLLRAQVKKLRGQLSMSRRIQWIRNGLTGANRKGGELLAAGFQPPITKTNYNLDVELNQSGGVQIAPLPPSISPPQ